MIFGLAVYLILKILGIALAVCTFIWIYLKFVEADELADTVESFGNKLLEIFGAIIKYLFYAIIILILYIIAINT